jgi:ribokinase
MSWPLLDLVDILIVNRVEAEMLSGLIVNDSASALAALPRLGAGRRDIVATLGGAGLVAQPRDAAPKVIAPIPVKVVSTHGAGDCFVGALARWLAAGADLMEAAAAANQSAAAHVSRNA